MTSSQPTTTYQSSDSPATASLINWKATTEILPLKCNLSVKSEAKTSTSYCGMFGSIQVHRKRRFLRQPHIKLEESIGEETTIIFAPSFTHGAIRLLCCKASDQISRSLSFSPRIPSNSIAFRWVGARDLQSFQNALSRREISPYVEDQSGDTLLHAACLHHSFGFRLLLVQLGVDADHVNKYGRKALETLVLRQS